MFLPWHLLKLARSNSRLEAGADLRIRDFAHAAPERIPKDGAFIADRLALKEPVPRPGDRFSCAHLFALLLSQCAGAGLGHHLVGLVAELCGKLAVGGKDFRRRENFFFVAC